MLGPARHHVEETMVTKTNENEEDIVEMDYAQPHRKPPIHNENPWLAITQNDLLLEFMFNYFTNKAFWIMCEDVISSFVFVNVS